ncbi:MAG TPA: prephenate dehydrogenase [Actinomycetota bacterium]
MSGPGGFADDAVPGGLGKVAIVGAGQVGTMLGIALTGADHEHGVAEVALFDRDADTARASLDRRAGHRVADDLRDALSADIVVLAVPVDEIVALLESHGGDVRPGALVIDTGSAKTAVVDAMRRTVPVEAHALGGHPMAGTATPGPSGAQPDLLAGAPFVLTPVRDDPEAMRLGRALASAVGARPVAMAADEHDRVIAWTSHLPHAMSFALAAAVGRLPDSVDEVRSLIAGGYRGATRLATGDPAMIAGFLGANAAEVGAAIDGLCAELSGLRDALPHRQRLAEMLATGRAARGALA